MLENSKDSADLHDLLFVDLVSVGVVVLLGQGEHRRVRGEGAAVVPAQIRLPTRLSATRADGDYDDHMKLNFEMNCVVMIMYSCADSYSAHGARACCISY